MSVVDAGLSERGLEYHNRGEMRDGYEMLYYNLYHPETNPTGYVNLGVSENVRQDSALRSFDLLCTPLSFSRQAPKVDNHRVSISLFGLIARISEDTYSNST